MFSPTVLDHVTRPRNCGPLEGATHRGAAGVPGDGPYMILEFLVVHGRIARAAYQTYGCPAAIASGSVVAELAVGKTPEQIVRWTAPDLIMVLGGVPDGKEHCPELSIQAVRGAFRKP